MEKRKFQYIDSSIIEAAQKQDSQAVADVYDQLGPRVKARLLRLSGGHPDVEDLTQEALTRIIVKMDRYSARPDRPFEAWALRVTRNYWIDHIRRENLRHRQEAKYAEQEIRRSQEAQETEQEEARRRESAERTRKLLETVGSKLTERARSVVELRLQGKTFKEIAAVTGRNINAVKKSNGYGVKRLKKLSEKTKFKPSMESTPLQSFQVIREIVLPSVNTVASPSFARTEAILADHEFMNWLFLTGFANRDPQERIDNFNQRIQNYSLTRMERAALLSYEPGELATTAIVADRVFGSHSQADIRAFTVSFSRAIKRLGEQDFDFDSITFPGERTQIRGIGCSTELTQKELLLVYLIPRDGTSTVAELELGRVVYGSDNINDEVIDQYLRTIKSRLKPKIPPSVNLKTDKITRQMRWLEVT